MHFSPGNRNAFCFSGSRTIKESRNEHREQLPLLTFGLDQRFQKRLRPRFQDHSESYLASPFVLEMKWIGTNALINWDKDHWFIIFATRGHGRKRPGDQQQQHLDQVSVS